MRLDLYQAETAQIATEQEALLDEARLKLIGGITLSGLEQNGVLHALQVLIENAIGKARQSKFSRPLRSRCQYRLMMLLLRWQE